MFRDFRVSVHKQYFVIANEHRALYEKYDLEMREGENTGVAEEELRETPERVFDLYENREKAAAIAITFAGMCLEAFLYDYASTELGDSYVKKHLDKLDMISKALIIPRLVCGKGIDKSGPVYASVRNLQKDRNNLVHFKSQRFAREDRANASKFHGDLNEKNRKGVANCTKAIASFVRELDRLHGHQDHFYREVCVW